MSFVNHVTTLADHPLVGRRVRFSGDICNAARQGTVTHVETDRWGTYATITWDDPRAHGWQSPAEGQEGVSTETVSWVQATNSIGVHLIGTRRWELDWFDLGKCRQVCQAVYGAAGHGG